jgi:two-component system sensor histidine kinase YesM
MLNWEMTYEGMRQAMNAIKRFWNLHNSFIGKLIIVLGLITFMSSLIVGTIVYRLNLQLFEKEVYKQYSAVNEQMLERFAMGVEEVERLSQFIVFHPSVIGYLKKSDQASLSQEMTIDQYIDMTSLHDVLNQVKVDASYLHAMFVYNMHDKNVYFDNYGSVYRLDDTSYTTIKNHLEGSNGALVWLNMHLPSSADPGALRDTVVAARWMKSMNQETYGLLVFVFETAFITQFVREPVSASTKTYLIAQENDVLYSNPVNIRYEDIPHFSEDKDRMLESTDDTHYLYVKYKTYAPDFTLISGTSLEKIRNETKGLFKIVVFSGLVSVALGSLIIILASIRLTRPLKMMVKAMQRIRAGHLETRVSVSTNDEFAYLGEGFNAMVDHINELINEVYIKQMKEREAELKMLQAQLNPHFLYNIFNEIYWKLYNQHVKDTAGIIKSLSDILRYSLKPIDQPTTLGEEMLQMENYLAIQIALFNQDLEYQIEIPDDLAQCQLTRFLIQPLVENVFVHAFKNKIGAKRLHIRALLAENKLAIEIVDNGNGIPEQYLLFLLQEDEHQFEHLGIRLVNRRIALTYGDQYGLHISSEVNEGTKMVLLLPYTCAV